MTNQAEKQRLLEEKKRRREKKKRRREDRLRKEEQIRELVIILRKRKRRELRIIMKVLKNSRTFFWFLRFEARLKWLFLGIVPFQFLSGKNKFNAR